jgi:hypothetical protein
MLCPLKIKQYYMCKIQEPLYIGHKNSKSGQKGTKYILTQKLEYGHKINNIPFCKNLYVQFARGGGPWSMNHSQYPNLQIHKIIYASPRQAQSSAGGDKGELRGGVSERHEWRAWVGLRMGGAVPLSVGGHDHANKTITEEVWVDRPKFWRSQGITSPGSCLDVVEASAALPLSPAPSPTTSATFSCKGSVSGPCLKPSSLYASYMGSLIGLGEEISTGTCWPSTSNMGMFP